MVAGVGVGTAMTINGACAHAYAHILYKGLLFMGAGTLLYAAGTAKLSVLPDGSVYPCYLLFSRPEFRLGNLLTDPFVAIWNEPRLEYFRTFRGNTCPRAACEHHATCRGGCPAVSLLVAGDLAAPDPRCLPRPGVLEISKTAGCS